MLSLGVLSGGAGKNSMCRPGAWQTLPATPALPESGRRKYVTVAGARIFIAEFGQGRPVILLRGGLANANYWGNQISAVSEQWRVIALDIRGHGRSTLGDQALTYQLFAQDVQAVMDHLQIQSAAVAGWSDGAIAGLSLASSNPYRVSTLFCFGTNISQSGVIKGGNRAPVFEQYIRRVASEYRALSPTPGGYVKLRAAMGLLWAQASGLQYSDLNHIQSPCWIVDGAHDEIILRSETVSIGRAIHGARVQIMPCVSHFAMLQDPAGFAEAIRASLDAW